MKNLQNMFEGILDADLDVTELGLKAHPMWDALFSGFSYKRDRFDPVLKDGVLTLNNQEPMYLDLYEDNADKYIKANNIHKIVFNKELILWDCSTVDFDLEGPDQLSIDGWHIKDLTFYRTNISCARLKIGSTTPIKITMRNTKIKCEDYGMCIYNLHALSIADTCKFDCEGLYIRAVTKGPFATKANKLEIGDFKKNQLINSLSEEDQPKYWDIDVWKCLGLKEKKWPKLNKIVIGGENHGSSVADCPGAVLYWPRRGGIALDSLAPVGELENYWWFGISKQIFKEIPYKFSY